MKITNCKLSRKLQRKLPEYLVLEVTARSAADLLEIQPNSAALTKQCFSYRKIRQVITYHLELEAQEVLEDAIELDESYFSGVRKGKPGRGGAGKVAVFGILKRGGKVYAKVVPDIKSDTLMPIITRKLALDSVVYTDCYRSYNALDVADFYHERINHSKQLGIGKNHIDGVENFWNQAKIVLRKYKGMDKKHFPCFLKSVSLDSIMDRPKSS